MSNDDYGPKYSCGINCKPTADLQCSVQCYVIPHVELINVTDMIYENFCCNGYKYWSPAISYVYDHNCAQMDEDWKTYNIFLPIDIALIVVSRGLTEKDPNF